ncbi:MAG: ankyrin repeat domain-containing protein [Verrucomicrobiae bacterium]|nr:ankyrin repeat domain-containing protein [Verrucomicrobiae bacterium]
MKNVFGMTPLMSAALCGDEEGARFQIGRGEGVDERDDAHGMTALMMAAQKGHLAVVRLLLEKGADAGAADADGTNVLMWAVPSGNAAVVECLLAAGADPAARNARGLNPAMMAAMLGFKDIVQLLKTPPSRIS